ncbi:MAG: hypothetical protein OXU73_00175 [Candidatus Campbellbacteria bacterium]|nr:hypothetical protein [Candidatus Campbellbacteria bacterium]
MPIKKFWQWYEKTERVQITLAFFLFILQIIHLVWLSGEVVIPRLFGVSLFSIEGIYAVLIAVIDYIEIPALITVNLVYINSLRKKEKPALPIVALILVNSQWLHLFWITDEIIVEHFTEGNSIVFHPILAWIAILIDYAEIPVMIDLARRFICIYKNPDNKSVCYSK